MSQAVNSTLDLQIVLETIVAKATQISGTEAGAIYVLDDRDKEFRLSATFGMRAACGRKPIGSNCFRVWPRQRRSHGPWIHRHQLIGFEPYDVNRFCRNDEET